MTSTKNGDLIRVPAGHYSPDEFARFFQGAAIRSPLRRSSRSLLTHHLKSLNMGHMPRHRFTRALPKLKENPYPDGNISFRTFMWDLYKETISCTEDERLYSNALVRRLSKEAVLIESYSKIEREIQDPDDEGIFYAGGFTLYLYKDNLITIKQQDDGAVTIDCYHPTSRKCVIDEFKKYVIKEKGESKVSVLVSRNGGLVANKISFAPPKIDDLELNYGTGFKKTYDVLLSKLNEQRGGLILLHGDPGTGKSYLLKHLTSIVNREFIFVGAAMIPRLADPELISLLLNKKGAVLILEDAEQAIQKRTESADASTTSTILNLTEGFMSSVLGVTVIASYNVDTSQVDPALLRRGRLLFKHSFTALSIKDAQRLAKHLKKDIPVTAPMTLADLYCSDDKSGHVPPEPPRQMGFHTLLGTTLKPEPVAQKVEKANKDVD